MIGAGEYLRAPEIARLLDCSERTVRRWIRTKVLSSAKVGGARLVARTELERLLRPAFSDPMGEE
jgi:excisionase family DNA binding protein